MTPRSLAGLAGSVFLLLGVLGFVPGIVQRYDELEWWGDGSRAELLHAFQVSIAHNLVHLATGAAGLALAGRVETARLYLLGGGLAYQALAVYGFWIERGSSVDVIPVDRADNWLHFALGVAMIVLGLLTIREALARRPAPTA